MTRWHPWRHLRDNHSHVDVTYPDLGGLGCLGRRRAGHIEIDETLDQVERRCTVTHEITHIERGPVPDHPFYGPKEERTVERITAERLIELDALIDALAWNRHRVDAETAGELWVDLDVLVTRVKNLTEDERRHIDMELERRQP
ncbi:hypothetical protein JGU71_28425 [Antrihabitans sp. YC3-6]|uniref:ImmA/IrrE family metallo-endopeptidase n=1 Tax=Antrihabitans stalagmiti TaxID=2799499 RepID=A0A934NWF9_9NOCA|nr:ImmA/IrrE family metallo-endopeptidase [Antrihabitans stalagmiti]MBJ8342823.1 hypothetical protein [Antrihabitans stalagmiti]